MSNKIYTWKSQQQGLALVVSLILLLVMTLLAINSMKTTVLEEKMAGNYKDYNMAFQSAEAGLRAGEQYLRDTAALPLFDGTTLGLYQPTNSGQSRWNVVDWSQTSQVRAYGNVAGLIPSGGDQLLAAEPYYLIEEMLPVVSVVGSVETGVALENRYYRITSRAVGGTTDSIVTLQSVYKR